MNPFAFVLAMSVFLAGCTTLEEVRTVHRSSPRIDSLAAETGCSYDAVTPEARRYSIEEYDDHWAGYVEFDDEGWLYRGDGQASQIAAFERRLQQDLRVPRYRDTDFIVVAFVHGWHHNAHDSDCNVHDFRTLLRVAAERYAKAYPVPFQKPRRIVGVYVGWRGESLNVDGLRYSTVIDRRNAAERVAKGDVRELFAVLRKVQIDASRQAGQDESRMRTVVIGHSFGGLIAFNGLSPAVLNELTLTRPRTEDCTGVVNRISLENGSAGSASSETHLPPVFPDLLMLINPAFEATRFESIHAQGLVVDGCPFPDIRPKVVVVTSDTDQWTGPVFTFGQQVLTALEAYPKSDRRALERNANTHAIGFTDRYVTHRLTLNKDGKPMATLDAAGLSDGPLDPCTPVWVVRAAGDIINGHDGFLYPNEKKADKGTPHLLNWIATLHAAWHDKSAFMDPPVACAPTQRAVGR